MSGLKRLTVNDKHKTFLFSPLLAEELPGRLESQKIYDVIKSVVSRGYDVVVIDDGSSDATADEASRAGAVVISHYINRGYGAALTTGNDWAHQNNYDIAIHQEFKNLIRF